jgi:hypothetical protein
MKVYKKVTKTVEQEVLDKWYCDICKATPPGGLNELDWRKENDEIQEVNFYRCIRKTGRNGCGCCWGGESEELTLEICPKCFDEKFLPWLSSQGVDVPSLVKEYDW